MTSISLATGWPFILGSPHPAPPLWLPSSSHLCPFLEKASPTPTETGFKVASCRDPYPSPDSRALNNFLRVIRQSPPYSFPRSRTVKVPRAPEPVPLAQNRRACGGCLTGACPPKEGLQARDQPRPKGARGARPPDSHLPAGTAAGAAAGAAEGVRPATWPARPAPGAALAPPHERPCPGGAAPGARRTPGPSAARAAPAARAAAVLTPAKDAATKQEGPRRATAEERRSAPAAHGK